MNNMSFIDKLEKLLLRPREKVYYSVTEFEDSEKILFKLGSYRGNYGTQDKKIKIDGIRAMMNKLRDNKYINPNYTDYSLDLISWEYFKEILDLEPTNEDLFNLYTIAGYENYNQLETFLKCVKEKNWQLKLFKYGYKYRYDDKYKLKIFTKYLPELTDDEWIDALTSYLNNSINSTESKQDLIDVCTYCIKDNKACEDFIRKMINEEISLSVLFNENKVNQLKINATSIIKHFKYEINLQVNLAFKVINELINKNITSINIKKFDFYINSDGNEYNFIIYDDNDNTGIETIKFIINEMMPILKKINLSEKSLEKAFNICNDDFIKLLLYFNMSKTAKIDKKEFKNKIVKI